MVAVVVSYQPASHFDVKAIDAIFRTKPNHVMLNNTRLS